MNHVLILIPSITLVLGGVLGYLIGRYQATLIDKIRTLQGQTREVVEPAVTMGVLTPPRDMGETDAPVGIVESKTPQRVEWEAENATEKQGLS